VIGRQPFAKVSGSWEELRLHAGLRSVRSEMFIALSLLLDEVAPLGAKCMGSRSAP